MSLWRLYNVIKYLKATAMGHIRGSVEQGFLGSLKSQLGIMRVIVNIISGLSGRDIYCGEEPENIFYTHTNALTYMSRYTR